MKPIPFHPMIAPPKIAASPPSRKAYPHLTDFARLCEAAGIPSRVTGGDPLRVALGPAQESIRCDNIRYVGLGQDFAKPAREKALRALEILTHAFHEYAAREAVCGRNLFSVPAKPGRPRSAGRPLSAAERMRRMRARPVRNDRSK